MATLNTFTIVGGLTADPEVRFNTNGKAMATFTIASSERSYDRERNEWVEKSTLYICVASCGARPLKTSLKRSVRETA